MKCIVFGFIAIFSQFAQAGQWTTESGRLTVSWATSGRSLELRNWALGELNQFKRIASREKDPSSGKLVKWDGILLSTIVEKGLSELPSEQRAQIDLVILKNSSGESALIPRSMISKYPILLALNWAGKSQDHRGPIYSIIPWSSNSKILKEDLPLEKFFLPQIARIELSNYRDRYSFLFLKRRTDPSAMRGEKLFVQNCASCHSSGQSSSLLGVRDKQQEVKFASGGHPEVKVKLKLSDRDRHSIVRYLDAYRMENPLSVSTEAPFIQTHLHSSQ